MLLTKSIAQEVAEEKGYSPSKLMNAIDLSIDVNLGDTFNSHRLKGTWLGYGHIIVLLYLNRHHSLAELKAVVIIRAFICSLISNVIEAYVGGFLKQ